MKAKEVKVLFGYWAANGFFKGVRTPGTAYSIMFRLCGENGLGFSQGGMGVNSEAIAASGRNHGLEIVTEAAVEKILTRDGRATGVVTTDGRESGARLFASNVAAPVTFGRMVPRDELPDEFMDAIDGWHGNG